MVKMSDNSGEVLQKILRKDAANEVYRIEP